MNSTTNPRTARPRRFDARPQAGNDSRAPRAEVDPPHVIRSHCGRNANQAGLTVKDVHEFDLGWIAEMVDTSGRDAVVRYIVTRNGKLSAMAGWVDVDTNVYQFMKRPGVGGDVA